MPSSIRCALITGASSGIGESLAYLLAAKGISLILHGRDQQKLIHIAQELQKNVPVQILTADLAVPAERQKIIEVIDKVLPDLIVNNAGFGLLGEALAYDVHQQLEILEVDAKAVLEFTLVAAKAYLSQRKKGIILNVSSAAGEVPVAPGFAVYAASKACVNHFSQSLDVEFSANGVRVLVACPGKVKSRFHQRAGQNKLALEDLMMNSQFAAEQIWKQIQREKGMNIFDWKTHVLVALSKWVPKKWVAYVYRHYIYPNTKKATLTE